MSELTDESLSIPVIAVIAGAAVLSYVGFKEDGEEPAGGLNPVLFVHEWTPL